MSATMNNRLAALLTDPFDVLVNYGRDYAGGSQARRAQPLDRREARVAPLTLWEDEQRVYLELDVPGLTRDELDLTIQEGKLSIRGERKRPLREGVCCYNERRFEPFERTISLADTIDTESIEAGLQEGVLSITLPKKPEVQPRRIVVRYYSGAEAGPAS